MSVVCVPVVLREIVRSQDRPSLRLAPRDGSFVGRERPLAAVVAALSAEAPRIWIGGASGLGKTALLAQLAAHCRERALPYHWLGPHEPATPSVLRAIADELARAVGPRGRGVLVIDDFAGLRSIERWFVEGFLPALPPAITVVVADRSAAPVWRVGDGASLALSLSPLDEPEAHRYLALRGVPDGLRAEIIAFAEGIPALLAAEAEAACAPPPATRHAYVDDRAKFYTRHASDAHRLAIAVLVAARTTPYELLELAFDDADAARDAFAWLSRLSVVDHTPHGLRPHALLRKACARDLADHAAASWARACRAVRGFADHRIAVAREPLRWVLDRLFVDRELATVRAHLSLPATETALAVAPAEHGDRAAIIACAAAQGDHAAAEITHWLDDDRAAFDVLRDPRGGLQGYLCSVALDVTSQPTGDPAVDLCVAHLDAIGWFGPATPPDARALVFRDWTVAGSHQSPSVGAALLIAQMASRLLTTPALDYQFVITESPATWIPVLRFLGLAPRAVAEHRRGGGTLTAIAADWRRCSIATVLQRTTEAVPGAKVVPALVTEAAAASPPGVRALATRTRGAAPSAVTRTTRTAATRAMPIVATPGEAPALSAVLARRLAELAKSAALSPREQEVLQLLLLGRNYTDIGVALEITPRTARFHQHNVLEKIGAESRLDIVRLLL